MSAAHQRLAELRKNPERPDNLAFGGLPPRHTGSGEESRVKAAADSGRLISLEILDPRLLRLPPGELAELLITSINDALADRDDGENGVDLESLARELREFRDEALGSLRRTMSELRGAVEQLRREAHVTMPVGIPDFSELLVSAEESLAAARGAAPGEEPVIAAGHDGHDQVRATVGAGGRVESLSLERAMRKPSHELAALVVAAVNSALRDLSEQRRESRAASAEERARRTRAIQDRSITDMRAFCDAMTTLMGSIRPNS